MDALVAEAHQAFGKVDIFLAIDLGRGVCAGVEFKLCLENKKTGGVPLRTSLVALLSVEWQGCI